MLPGLKTPPVSKYSGCCSSAVPKRFSTCTQKCPTIQRVNAFRNGQPGRWLRAETGFCITRVLCFTVKS